VTGFKA